MSEIVWHGQAGHFVGWRDCQWHLCTEVNGYIISTLGEYIPNRQRNTVGQAMPLGLSPDDLYESMIFEVGGHCPCGCGHPTQSGSSLDMNRYKTPLEARLGHMKLVEEYSKKTK